MILEHMMFGSAISNHDKMHINQKPFSGAMQQYQTMLEKSFPEGEMNLTMIRCASQISFV